MRTITTRRCAVRRTFLVGAGSASLLALSSLLANQVELADVTAGFGGFVANGDAVQSWSGTSVGGGGDVNGDGLTDLIIGAPLGGPAGAAEAGLGYVVFGRADTAAVDLGSIADTGGFLIRGAAPVEHAGWSVAVVGDLNGDDLDDVVIGAPDASPGDRTRAGAAYVVFGKDTPLPVDLSNVANGQGGFIIEGRLPFDHAGLSVSGAGDVNDDGTPDLVVGAPGASPGGVAGAGAAYVVFGKADTAAVRLDDVAQGSGGFVMNGVAAMDCAGESVSGAGDVDADGHADVIIGAPCADPGGDASAGSSYVVLGRAVTGAVDLADVASGAGGFVIDGYGLGSSSGRSVASAGDVNADGLGDVIIGSTDYAFAMSYVVFGKTDTRAVALADVEAGLGGFVIDVGEATGESVAGAGDVNGDGRDDLVLGAPGLLDDDRSYVVYGRASTEPVTTEDLAAGFGGFVIAASGNDARSGVSVAAAGDVNDDGLADIIAGAPRADPDGRTAAGRSHLVFGVPASCPADLDGTGDVAFEDLLRVLYRWGPCPGCVEDLDGDGVVEFTDLLIVLESWGPCPEPGACCLPDGTCEIAPCVGGVSCLARGGTYQGDDVGCPAVTCPQPGACCLPDGACAQETSVDAETCLASGGVYEGDDTTCASVICPQPGACCFADQTCAASELLGGPDCTAAGGLYRGDDVACADADCPPPSGCCFSDGACTQQFEPECLAAGGLPQGDGTLCADDICPQPGACCFADGTCEEVALVGGDACLAADAIYQGDDTTCATVMCPPPAACCLPDGTCEQQFDFACLANGGAPQGVDTLCAEVVCTQPGACCFPLDGTCAPAQLVGGADCIDAGGEYQGDDILCVDTSCPGPGACCFSDTSCEVLQEEDCADAGGTYLGDLTICNVDCSSGACCLDDGSCFFVEPNVCGVLGGAYQGDGLPCEDVQCP